MNSLHGIRVLDLSRVLAGPWCTQTLADLGADVIKIERPITGDDTRTWGPPFLKDAQGRDTAEAAYFLGTNRNKRSLTCDIAAPAGQALIRELVLHCNVFIENFKVGDMARYGLDYDSLKLLNPKLVYCSVTGFGQTGPYADRAGYDYAVQGIGGLMSITGERDGKAGGGPQKVGVAITDVMTGLYSTIGILSALRARDLTGEGQHLDMALMDVQVAALANQASSYLVTGVSPVRLGNEHPSITPYQSLPASDGYFILAIGNDSQFRSFCQAAGHPQLSSDVRFLTNKDRVTHRDQLTPLLEEITRTRRIDDWTLIMERAGVPCGPINTLERVFADPHVKARGLRVDIPHAQYGSVPSVANPIRLSKTPLHYQQAPPQLGEHNELVLQGLLGLSQEEVRRLQEAGIL